MDKEIKEIIPPVEKELLAKELTEDRFLRHSSKGGNHLYLVTNQNAPNVVREIGRLREITFREAGGGTGKTMDLDSYDLSETVPYMQLISWDPDEKEIIAGYRLLMCKHAEKDEEGNMVTATSHLFKMSDKFYNDYMPYTLELGRSFVQPKYQRKSPKGIFSLDNLWDGLGAMAYTNPEVKYFLGKVTMYPDFNQPARNMILSFAKHFFPDDIGLGDPVYPLIRGNELEEFGSVWKGKAYKEAYAILNKGVRDRGENIPPLINSYMNLTDTMKTFGTSINPNFGDVEETGILVTVDDIHEAKKERYLYTYDANKNLHSTSEK